MKSPRHRYFGALGAQPKLFPHFGTYIRSIFSVICLIFQNMPANLPVFNSVGYCGRICLTFIWPLIFVTSQSNVFSNNGEGRDGNRQTDTLETPPFPQRSSERNLLMFFFFIHQCFKSLCPLSDYLALLENVICTWFSSKIQILC